MMGGKSMITDLWLFVILMATKNSEICFLLP